MASIRFLFTKKSTNACLPFAKKGLRTLRLLENILWNDTTSVEPFERGSSCNIWCKITENLAETTSYQQSMVKHVALLLLQDLDDFL